MLLQDMLKTLFLVLFGGMFIYLVARSFWSLRASGKAYAADDNESNESKDGVLPVPVTREEKIRYGHFLRGKGLEICPGHQPIAPKNSGWDVETLDYADHESKEDPQNSGKKKNVASDDVDQESLGVSNPDYVWAGGALTKATGKKNYYNWILGSHVLSYVPDIVGFIQGCMAMLTDRGMLVLEIKDRRYSEQVCRPISTPGQVIQAYEEKRTRHTLGTLWDEAALACVKKGTRETEALGLDGQGTDEKPETGSDTENDWVVVGDDEAGRTKLRDAQATSRYIHARAWAFTPASFKLMLHDVCALGHLGCTIEHFFETAQGTFIVHLKKVSIAESYRCDRKYIAKQALQESVILKGTHSAETLQDDLETAACANSAIEEERASKRAA